MPSTVATLAANSLRPVAFSPSEAPHGGWFIVPGDNRGWHDVSKPGLIYCVGYTGTPAQAATGFGEYTRFLHDLVDAVGIPMFLPGGCSNGWGNDTEYANVVTGINWYTTYAGIDPNRLILSGGSMGGATMCRYTRSNKAKVIALVGLEPVTDLTDIHTNNREGFRTAINAAYGGSYSEAVYGATNNPATMAANGVFDGIPYMAVAAEGDPVCMLATIQKIADDIGGGKCYVSPGASHGYAFERRHVRWVDDHIPGDPLWAHKTYAVAGDTVDEFYADGIYTAPAYPVAVRVLAVGGGGGGGGTYGTGSGGGGGGGGEVREVTFNIHGPTSVAVGRGGIGGGRGTGRNGETSTMGLATSLGGGGGGHALFDLPFPQPPAGGLGTGGGGGYGSNPAKGVAIGTGGDGSPGASGVGGHGGGGGGAGGVDALDPNGTAGKTSDITGTVVHYGGGGGGCVGNTHAGKGYGGSGGGGNGGGNVAHSGATANAPGEGVHGLGGGGGGNGGFGGWGVVIVRRGPSIPAIPPSTATVTSLVPDTGLQSGGVTVDVNGTGFVAGTKVLVDLQEVQTTYVSATKVTTAFLGTLSTAKAYSVRVQNPNEDVSNALTYTVNVTPPSSATVTGLNPTTAPASGGVTVEVNGTAFTASTVVVIAGSAVQTTYVSATKVTTNFFATYANEGVVQVGVRKPSEQVSNTLPFTVTAAGAPVTSGLWAWYDAAHDASFVTGAGSEVSKWKNKEGTAVRDWGVIGGNPIRGGSQLGNKFTSVRVTGGMFYLGRTSIIDNISIFTVARTLNVSPRVSWLSFGNIHLSHALPTSLKYGVNHQGVGQLTDGDELVNDWSVQSYTRDTTTARVRRDGAEVASGTTPGLTTGGEWYIGGWWTGSGYRVDCDVGEILIYNRVLDSTEIGTIEAYLAQKWIGPPTVPGPPTLNTVTPGDGQATLVWTGGSTGRSPITDYIIQKSPDGSTAWTTVTESVSTATTYTVTGLTNGTIQHFRVAAVNAIGTGAWSNTLSATPVPPPELPSIAGLVAWWDAADASTFTYSSGTVVSQWRDKSGGNRHLAQAVVANQPTRSGTQNGKPTVIFDGSNDVVATSAPVTTANNNVTIIVACKRTGGETVQCVVLFNGDPAGNGYGMAVRANGPTIGLLVGGIAWRAASPGDPAAAGVLALRRTAGSWSMHLNGVTAGLGAADTPNTPTASTMIPSTSHQFGGEIYEAVIYAAALTDTERQEVEAYLKAKWGTP